MRRLRAAGALLATGVAGFAIAVMVGAAPAGAAGPWHTGRVSTGGTALDMACAGTARCYAITWTRITTRDGNVVTSAPAPLPGGAAASDEIFMRSISCPGADSCLAVGSIHPATERDFSGLVEQISSSGVVASEVAPSAGYNTLGFNAVSCPAVGGCYAVGTEQIYNALGAVTTRTPVYAHQVGATWDIHALPVDAGNISCPTTSWCVMLSATSIVTLSGTQLSRQAIPTPANYFRAVEVDGFDCPSTGNCTFVGLDQRHVRGLPLIKRPVVGVLHAGAWRVRLTDLPADVARGDALKAQPLSLSCPGATHCVAVGSYATSRRFVNAGLIIHRSGDSVWVRAAPLPTGTSTKPPSGGLNSVSCASVTSCDSVGVLGNRAVDDVWNGSTWHATVIPPLAGQPTPSALEFDTVACPAVANCFATGGYAWRLNANGQFTAFTEAYAVKN